MTWVCDFCARDIDASNVGWPGYCSPRCRDAMAAWRDAERRQARRVAQWKRAKAAGQVAPGTQAPWVRRPGSSQ